MLDLVIIGAAAAGSAAAVYAARRNLNFAVVAKDIGGEVALSGEVENWPGTIHTTGVELAQNFHAHMKSYQVQIDNGLEVTGITPTKNYHIVTAQDGNGQEKTYETKSVIIASGIHPRELKIPGERELKGRGVTYCTVCDGPLYRGKTTATVGAGNSALESVLMMSGIASQVYLITKYPDLPEAKGGFPKGEDILINKVKALPNVTVIYNAGTVHIVGTDAVSGLIYEDLASGARTELAVQGVMVHVGPIYLINK
ncbi:MAG: Alkyl hydroperoxide reductase, F subunit [Candidatus Magasanikbacteria bacterium GW2011_GWA2_56_11]|uniref:Alkyl hydroperoxide reductase, F subunit n=1 Tax=Candidatus Magasanikbacteria bacterium GW2011_GWA2_56_11 TaxID=1619044 RepID=A0A0G2BB56_9BACT|nr:MAG: Alkyl hydroperoxide reductase, F subunit [Candidatus Magasanikbacteria bacterium GW2011_GWA2_56_11]